MGEAVSGVINVSAYGVIQPRTDTRRILAAAMLLLLPSLPATALERKSKEKKSHRGTDREPRG